jgi:hypothetical protein
MSSTSMQMSFVVLGHAHMPAMLDVFEQDLFRKTAF